jgi:hypothetical protein
MPIKPIFNMPIQLNEVLKACIRLNIKEEIMILRYLFDRLYKLVKMNPLDIASSEIATRKNIIAYSRML